MGPRQRKQGTIFFLLRAKQVPSRLSQHCFTTCSEHSAAPLPSQPLRLFGQSLALPQTPTVGISHSYEAERTGVPGPCSSRTNATNAHNPFRKLTVAKLLKKLPASLWVRNISYRLRGTSQPVHIFGQVNPDGCVMGSCIVLSDRN
jgi:hypothetical protein